MTAGATTSAAFSPVNAGNHADGVRATIEIVGPARNPRVFWTRGSEIRTFAVDADIQAGERLIVDMDKRSIIIVSAVTGAYLRDGLQYLRLDSRWFTLMPGALQISVVALDQ